MKIYYSHCMAIYDTPQEERDIEYLKRFGFEIVNPNTPEINEQVSDFRAKYPEVYGAKTTSQEIMDSIFLPMLQGCDGLVFRSLPDGSIPAGVALEIQTAKDAGMPILELPSSTLRRTLTVEETRSYLQEIGQR